MRKKFFLGAVTASFFTAATGLAAELLVGVAEVSITPDRPISLAGQFHQRIARSVESPCMACVLALESRDANQASDQAILVAMDVGGVTAQIQSDFRAHVAQRLMGFDTNKLFLAATHTHTGPTLSQKSYADYHDAMQPDEYLPFMYDRMADAVVKAWEGRKPGGVAWGLGHAVVGHNRRVAYADGRSEMYGKVNQDDFRNLEGWEDHAVDVLGFTDADKKLIAAMLVVPCPSQTVEMMSQVSSDYWGDVRENLRTKYGRDLVVLGFCGPGGDVMPRPMLRNAAEQRMEKLRKLSRKQEVGRRIAQAFDETWDAVRQDIRTDVALVHRVERFAVPARKITDKELGEARTQHAAFSAQASAATEAQAKSYAEGRRNWFQRTIDLYEAQQKAEIVNRLELHVLRLGGLAIATNPFEFFQDYAMRIHGRSAAPQTALIQLASPSDERHSYLPSGRAVAGGGYSAVPQSTPVGPEGGQMVVDRTLRVIAELFRKRK